ncbi:DNA damage-repair/toleration protein DRT100 [Linum grandiflorum]
MKSLKHLDLSSNKLSGKIPTDFGRLKMLGRAPMSRNQLEGSIPESVSEMYRLANLD